MIVPWKYPGLSYHPPPPQKDPRTMSASHVLERDDGGLSFREVIAGLVPGSHVWEIRPGIFCSSLLGSECKPQARY